MAWTANLRAAEKRADGRLYWIIDFSDGKGQQRSREYVVSPGDTPKALAAAFITILDAADTASAIVPGPIDLTPDIVVKPPADAAKEKWLADKATWKRLTNELALGLNATKQTDVDSAYALMKSEYLSDYGVFLP